MLKKADKGRGRKQTLSLWTTPCRKQAASTINFKSNKHFTQRTTQFLKTMTLQPGTVRKFWGFGFVVSFEFAFLGYYNSNRWIVGFEPGEKT